MGKGIDEGKNRRKKTSQEEQLSKPDFNCQQKLSSQKFPGVKRLIWLLKMCCKSSA